LTIDGRQRTTGDARRHRVRRRARAPSPTPHTERDVDSSGPQQGNGRFAGGEFRPRKGIRTLPTQAEIINHLAILQ
jgi:hypothetical protein